MSNNRFYFGSEFSVADSKGRYTLPPEMRKLVRHQSFDRTQLYVRTHADQLCAIGFGEMRFNEISHEIEERARIARERETPFNTEHEYEKAIGTIETINFDDGGRFSLPPFMRRKLAMDRIMVFVGAGPHIHMWSPEKLLESEGRPADLREKVQDYLDNFKASGK